jgi:hypothetical protein
MLNARIDISQDMEGDAVVYACFDLREDEVAAIARAVAATSAERFRSTSMSADDVLEFRELTSLGDELGEPGAGMRTLVMTPGRILVLCGAVGHFVESRSEADWIRDEDREPLELLRGLRNPLDQLCEEATRAALSPAHRGHLT